MRRKKPLRQALGELDPAAVRRLIDSCSDIALVLDGEGSVLEVTGSGADMAGLAIAAWVGRPWIDTVTPDSRDKVTGLLRDAEVAPATRWRQVNHPVRGGDDLPVQYSLVRVVEGDAGPATRRIVAFGRDLRGAVSLQQRLVETQQAMERDYWRFREAETRYRNLFQTSHEAVLIVDAQTMKVVEANPAADAICAALRPRLVGSLFTTLFDPAAAPALQALTAAARTIGKREPVRLALADATAVTLSMSVFRQEDATFVLARLAPAAGETPRARAAARSAPAAQAADAVLRNFVELAPDGIVFTDPSGRVLSVNRAFAALAQLSGEDQARGQMLDRWLGRTGVELNVLIGNLRQRGSVGLFTTTIRGEFGANTEVEIAAAALPDGPQGGALAFSVRDVARRMHVEDRGAATARLPRSMGELTELVGRVALKDIVSETTDLIEQMAIQAALQMTGDNRASAAQLLGLSRQSLYVKLRRFGIGDLGGEH